MKTADVRPGSFSHSLTTAVLGELSFLVVDDEPNFLMLVQRMLEDAGIRNVHGFVSAFQAMAWAKANEFHVALVDVRMREINGLNLIKSLQPLHPDVLFVLVTAYADLSTSIEALRLRLFDLVLKPVGANELEVLLERIRKHIELKGKNNLLQGMLKESRGEPRLLGRSPALQEIREKARLFAQHFEPVLITGETGTGKEVVARLVHEEGQRYKYKFIAVNCSAYPDTLLESELFGHEKGAFTGADRQRIGKLELAGRGTILLDEVCEISPQIQVKLLRVLQEKEYERLGGNNPQRMLARVISATNRNIDEAIAANWLRHDFYYRLNRLQIHIPPLRERPEDIEYLAARFLHGFALMHGKMITGLAEETMSLLLNHTWPGNVRQLQSVMDYAALCCGGDVVHPEDLPQSFYREMRADESEGRLAAGSKFEPSGNVPRSVETYEKERMLAALARCTWNRSKAARELGFTRTQMLYRMKKYGIG